MPEPARTADLKSVHATFEALFNAGDLDGLVNLYEPDALIVPSPAGPARGHAAIREALSGFLSLGGKIAMTTISIFEAADGLALIHCNWWLTGGSTDLTGKSAEVLRRQPDGRWLYVIDNPWA